MAADATFTPPESVTIPGETVIETLALLEAFVTICAEVRGTPEEVSDLYELEAGSDALREALPDETGGTDTPAWRGAVYDRAAELERELRGLLRGSESLRLAELEEAVLRLGQEVVGVFWSDDRRRWLTAKEYFADVSEATHA